MTELQQLQQNVANAQAAYDLKVAEYMQDRNNAIAILDSIKSQYNSGTWFTNRTIDDFYGVLIPTSASDARYNASLSDTDNLGCKNNPSCNQSASNYDNLRYQYKIRKNTAEGALKDNLNAAKKALADYLATHPTTGTSTSTSTSTFIGTSTVTGTPMQPEREKTGGRNIKIIIAVLVIAMFVFLILRKK